MKQLRNNFKKDLKNKVRQQDQHSLLSQDLFMNRKIVYPQKLKILVLSGNEVVNQQLEFIKKCTSLLKLDISNNNITKISKKLLIKDLKNLRVIHLHNNRIDKIQGLQGIFSSQSIQYLTLHNNPVMKLPKIQHLVTNMINSLRVLNKRIINVQERSPQLFNQRKSIQIDDQFLEKWKSTSSSQAYYIRVLQLQISYIENVWIRSNPIVYIQRIWKAIVAQNKSKHQSPRSPLLKKRGFSKKQKTEENQELALVRKAFNDWKEMIQSVQAIRNILRDEDETKDKEYLTYPLQKYKVALRNLKVRNVVRSTVNNTRQTLFMKKMAGLIKNALYQRSQMFNRYSGFYYAVGIDQDHRIYFNKSQKHLLQNILLHIQKNFKIQDILNQCKIKKSEQYLSIRMVDPETYQSKKVYSILTYLMWPSSRVIFLKKRKPRRQMKNSFIKIKPLKYMQNKNKVLTPQQVKKSIEVFKRVERFAKNQYQESLLYMQCENQFVMKMLIRYVFYHNTKKIDLKNIRVQGKAASLLQNYQQPFVMYSRNLLERTAAAVRIQQNWRTYMANKLERQNVSFKMKKNRSVQRIQRFYRNLAFNHRLHFHKQLQNKLFTIKTTEILIHRQIYFQLKQLCESNGVQLYPGLRMRKNKKQLDLFWKMNNYVFPPSLVDRHFTKDKRLSIAQSWSTDIYDLLHLRSKVEIVEYRNAQFYRFTFENIKQTRFRVAILALLTYRVYGKKFLWPITVDSIDEIQSLIQQYKKFSILKDVSIGSKNQQDKVIKKSQIKDNGPFLFSSNFKQVKPNFKQINLQFYQKKYQNFPIKFIGDLLYWIPQNQRIPIQTTQEQRMSALQQRLTKDISQIQQQQDIQSNEENFKPKRKQKLMQQSKTANLASMQNSMNVTKIDKKRLSFYDIGCTQEAKRDIQSEKAKYQQTQKSYLQTKRQWVVKTNQQQKYRKQLQKQRKKNQISSIRTRLQAERNKNQSFRTIKQMERTQNVRKQVQKIKAFKSRASSTKKETESDFIQQGNFVMEQQLKMIIMRNKLKESESIKQSHTMNVSMRNKQRFGETMSVHSRQQSKDSKSEKLEIPLRQSEIQGNQSQIRNTKVSFGRRTRTHSIGAHIRDPAMVHGVFPEEYYPIEHKGNIKLLFPPL